MNEVLQAHENEYSVKPRVVVSTPGRFHLIGEHSWFFRDKTISMAVNLPVYIAASCRDDNSLFFNFPQLKEKKRCSLTVLKNKKEDKWANALKAVIYGFTSGGFNITGGIDFTVYSDILPSAGFGITTAIKVGTALAVRKLFDIKCSDAEILQVIERANKRFLQIENHLADNFTALYSQKGNLLLTNYGKFSYDSIPFNFEGKKILLIDAKVPRINLWNEEIMQEPENVLLLGELKEHKQNAYGGWVYEENPTEVNEVLNVVSEDMRRRLMCIIREHKAVLEARDALITNSFGKFARYVNFSHESMRDLYEISCPEIDWILKRLLEITQNADDVRNPFGCGRITGKGFGRCLYAVLPEENVEEFKKKITEFERIFGFHPVCYEVESSDGAHVVEQA